MPMTVPNEGEWTTAPGFEVQPCFCQRQCGVAIFDCGSCRGTGLLGLVPCGVWDDCYGKPGFPDYRGDPRFDPRAGVSLRFYPPGDPTEPRDEDVAPVSSEFGLILIGIVGGVFLLGALTAAAYAFFPR